MRFLTRPEAKEKFFSAGSEVVARLLDEFAVTVKSEMARMGKVIENIGIRAD